MSEALLWRLYRRLLAERMLLDRLPGSGKAVVEKGLGIAAALTENLLAGDTLGLPPHDAATRYLCGVPLAELRAGRAGSARRKAGGWAYATDAEHGLLPGAGAEQATLAVGTALAARLHGTGSLTVLVDGTPGKAGSAAHQASAETWKYAVQMAVSLQLPLLFVSPFSAAQPSGPRSAPTPLPGIPVDRHDALALYRVIYESATRARAGGGPTWIECARWPMTEPESALDRMEQALRSRKQFDAKRHRQMEESLRKELAQAGESWLQVRQP